MSKVDHFIEFINRPYFYQDVSFGTKLLKLDSGETIEMPNVVDDLEKGGLARQWCTEVKERLKDAKRYLKTGYRVHCKPETATCPDHC